MYEHSPLLKAVMHNTEAYSDKTAIIMNGQEVSYSALGTNIRKAASVLQHIGLRAGDRVILSAHKDVEYVYLYFAAHMLGVTNVIVDAESNAERLHFIENKIRPACCFGYKSSKFPSKLFDELDLNNAEEMSESTATLAPTLQKSSSLQEQRVTPRECVCRTTTSIHLLPTSMDI